MRREAGLIEDQFDFLFEEAGQRLSYEDVSRDVCVYVNRLSDLLFAWARQANAQAGVPDVEWTPGQRDE